MFGKTYGQITRNQFSRVFRPLLVRGFGPRAVENSQPPAASRQPPGSKDYTFPLSCPASLSLERWAGSGAEGGLGGLQDFVFFDHIGGSRERFSEKVPNYRVRKTPLITQKNT